MLFFFLPFFFCLLQVLLGCARARGRARQLASNAVTASTTSAKRSRNDTTDWWRARSSVSLKLLRGPGGAGGVRGERRNPHTRGEGASRP